MTNPQKEYGSYNDPVLVPTSLLVYRRFRLSAEGQLKSMTGRDTGYRKEFVSLTGQFEARCRKAQSTRVFHSVLYEEIEPYFPPHSAPEVGCECGYYAHYSPDDNFFPGEMTFSDRSFHAPTGILFGAIEVSGKTICGSRGVRAERMKIRALSFDWATIRFFDGIRYCDVQPKWTEYLQSRVEQYDAKAYRSKEAIIEDFPRPDISELLEK